jgi:hypothetical protein
MMEESDGLQVRCNGKGRASAPPCSFLPTVMPTTVDRLYSHMTPEMSDSRENALQIEISGKIG